MRNRITAAIAGVAMTLAITGCTTGSSGHPFVAKGNHAKGSKGSKASSESNLTPAQKNAIGSAQDYLSTGHFSRLGLIEQLSSKYGDQFKKPLAVWAVNHIKVNWNKQATGAAKDYLKTGHFSRQGLIDQLSSSFGDKFTVAQATYGVTHAGL
jgi:hypothetical protein